MLMVVPDPERVGSNAPQDMPDLGVTVPCKLTESGRTRKEWETLIKDGDLPLKIIDEKAGD
jgi:hypothetical protein